uniref:Uncharacterized protein n=1 Tax=Anopheles funestus TaxID=62324 RepID=A0A182RHI8_ANOFN
MAVWNRFLLVVVLLAHTSGGEWVEIPHLKPSITSISTTIKPIASINGHVVTHSQRLLSHLADERVAAEGRWPAGTSVRWHRPPVSDLLDYEVPTKRVSQPPSPWITGDRAAVPAHSAPIALVNVSNKVDELVESDEVDDHYPELMQTELLPFSNRYEEESIETVAAASDTSKAMQSPVPPSVQHFDDFDDYDERLPVRMQQQPPHNEEQYSEADDDQEDSNETVEQVEKDQQPANLQQQQPPTGGFGGFVEFLRRMQASFVRRTAHTIGDKIRTLAEMRDQLLSSIERRIASLWMGGKQPTARRRVKRGWMEPHGETDAMDFPSAEGALLTISFLTFAVFLIKLVLQVINTIKAKHYTYSTFAAATPVSGGLLVKRTRRFVEPYELQAILATIDGYRPV